MDDMHRDDQALQDSTTPAVDRAERPAAGARVSRMLANPRRVRRA